MKSLAWTLIVAALAIAAALAAQGNEGRVVLLVPPHRIDLSFNLFVLLLVVALYAALIGGRVQQKLRDFPERVHAYRQRREEVGAQNALRNCLKAMFEGRFTRAERAARAALTVPGAAGLAALLAARAAHRMQQHERRDAWLARAEADPEMATARLVSAAEMWAESRDDQRALDAIDRLQASGARHIHAMRIALSARLQARRYADVLHSVRTLEKHRALHPLAAQRLKRAAYLGLLLERRADAAALEAAWRAIPAGDRVDATFALAAARLLNAAGCGAAAAAALEAALDHQWDESLLDEYAAAAGVPARPQLERAEAWLAQHPGSAALLRCLGVLCLRGQLWGKARGYLEDSLRQQPGDTRTHLAAARLYEALDDGATAARHYREAALGQPAEAVPGAAAQVRYVAREFAA